VTSHLTLVKVEPPPERSGRHQGRVRRELVDKLKNEAKVI
jgi:electron transfer flavoprotein beta subunit